MRRAASVFSIVAIGWVALSPASPASDVSDSINALQSSIRQNQWDTAGEIARDILARDPSNPTARIQGAYALFQKGYPNSALLLLKGVSSSDWRKIPEGQDRLGEIVLFFQKKVPITALPGRLEELRVDDASSAMREEIQLAHGRAAYDRGDYTQAESFLQNVSQASRYFAEAHYLLGAIAVKRKDYDRATAEFNRIFEPALFEKATEFWKDLGTQSTSHWGTNLRISLDAQSVEENSKVGELALLALARIAYARKDYESAIRYYDRLSDSSPFYPRATLEKIWALLQLNRHDDAEKVARDLSVGERTFEAIEASPMRALVLTDAGHPEQGREELDRFDKLYADALKKFSEFEARSSEGAMSAADREKQLPDFLATDLAQDEQLRTLRLYLTGLNQEIAALKREDFQLFPLYARMANDLEPAVAEAGSSIQERISQHVERRRADLERLRIQAKLIRAETYLEEREQLRAKIKANPTSDPKEQSEHEAKLLSLLQSAVDEVDAATGKATGNLRLDLRQSELVWELGDGYEIQKNDAVASALKKRALGLAREIALHHRQFEGHARALFFTGYMLYDMGQFEASYPLLEDYVRTYPRQEHAPDAFRILGDARFDADDFAAAERYYEKILEFPDSPVVGYALYKIGWCAYNRRDFGRALLGLEKAVLWTLSTTNSAQLSLKRESRHDLISIYAEVGDASKAWDYFSRFLQDDPVGWIRELAQELDRIGQYEKSALLYRGLIARDPGSKDNLAYTAALLHGAYLLRRWPDVLVAATTLADRYAGELKTPAKEGDVAFDVETIFHEVALGSLFEARKAPSPEATERTIRIDSLYLKDFALWPSSEEPLLRHAQFLLDNNRPQPAVDAFKDHWTRFGASLQEPRKEESLRGFLRALEAAESSVPKPKAPAAPLASATPLPGPDLSPTAADILTYADAYVASYPRNAHTRAILFLKSAILFKYDRMADGMALAQRLFDENPSDDVGKRSFQNLRVAYYDQKDWQKTYQWASGQLARKGMDAYRSDLQAVREEALFLWAQGTKDDAAASKLYLQLANDPTMNRLRDKSLYNAFLRVENGPQKDSKIQALQIADRLQKSAPDFAPLSDIAGVRAADYQESGDYDRAGPLLEQFLSSPPKSATADQIQQATLNLALIEEGQGQPRAALARLKTIQAKSPAAKQAAERIARSLVPAGGAGHSRKWAALLDSEEEFERKPIPKHGELQSRIKRGGRALEALSRDLLSFAGDASSRSEDAPDERMEAFCSLPFLYDQYGAALAALPSEKSVRPKDAPELRKALAPLIAPLTKKAQALAGQCLQKSADIDHTGPRYAAAVARWGWRSNAALAARADALARSLQAKAPWLDDRATTLTEPEILALHMQGKGTDDSWYALAMLRLKNKRPGMSRLTLIDALAKATRKGRILNALAVLEENTRSAPVRSLLPLFEKAAAEGSSAAWANLALLHLREFRLASAETALQRGLTAGTFSSDPALSASIASLIQAAPIPHEPAISGDPLK